jgi:hypothetical protein
MKAMSIIGIIVFFLFFLAAYTLLNDVNFVVGRTVTITEDTVASFQGRRLGNILVGLYGMAFSIVAAVHSFRKRKPKKINTNNNIS